ncbi:MAG: hypothetical protein AMXMBFR64_28670 [Myxococcales bacterium]
MRVLLVIAVIAAGCSGKSAQGGGASTAPPSPPPASHSPPAAPAAAPAELEKQVVLPNPGVPGCGDFEALERRIGDGLLTPDELTCLRGRLVASLDDTGRYRVVHLLTIDLDANGLGVEAMEVRKAEMPKIDCGKVEERLRAVCELQKRAAE